MLSLRVVVLLSLFIKISILVIYNILSVDPSFQYFQNDGALHDDEKYFRTILSYIENASGLWDWEQLKSSTLMNGHNMAGRDGLWFIIISVLGKLTTSALSVQLLNIFLSTISIVYLFKLSEKLFNVDVAKLAIVFVGFNPYISIFSIFPYKDNLVQLLFLVIFYELVKGFMNNGFKVSSILLVIFLVAIIGQLRSGLDYIALGILSVFYLRNIKSTSLKIFIYCFIVASALFILQRFSGQMDLVPRVQGIVKYYILQDRMEGLGSLLRIDSLGKLFLLPFTMIFTFSSPFMTSIVETISSWYDVTTLLNTLYLPLYALGLFKIFEDVIRRNNVNRIITFFIISIASLVAIISFGIFRHAYFLIPFILMYSASAMVKYGNVINVSFFIVIYCLLILIFVFRII